MRVSPARRVLLFVLAAAFGGLPEAALCQPTYSVQIDPGVSPRMLPAEVARGFQEGDQGDEGSGTWHASQVLSLHCLRAGDIAEAEAEAGLPKFDLPGKAGNDVVWFVRVHGRFVNLRTPPGVPAQVTDTGFAVIDDATGGLVISGGLAPSWPSLPSLPGSGGGQGLIKGR